MQARPRDEPEAALHRAATIKDKTRRLESLAAVARTHPGTAVSGLARLAIGLIHLEDERFGEAQVALMSPDLRHTSVEDRGLLALGRAQEGAKQDGAAAQTYARLLETYPQSPLLCDALSRGADAWSRTSRRELAEPLLQRLLNECPGWEPGALLRLGQFHESRGRLREAFEYYDRLDCDYAASPRSAEAARRLKALKGKVPPLPPGVRFERDLRKAVALSDAGNHKAAAPLLQALLARGPTGANAEIVRIRLGRALLALDRGQEAIPYLQAIPSGSVFAAEAAFLLARIRVGREKKPAAYEQVVASFPTSQWAEEALLALAHFYQKDARHAEAVPYYRRLLAAFPDGRYLETASWWAGWWEYRSNNLEEAVRIFENVARRRPASLSTGGALYWAGRARQRLGQYGPSRSLFERTVKGFKHTYHGLRAAEALGLVREGASSTHPVQMAPADAGNRTPEPFRTRVRQLLLVEQLDSARHELERAARGAEAQATIAWIHSRQGRLRASIQAMRQAYPDWRSEAGDRLPDAVWRILYPLGYEEPLVERAREQGLDSALVAALIWQESAFDPNAVSAAGASGLMQLMARTGQMLARAAGLVPKRPPPAPRARRTSRRGRAAARRAPPPPPPINLLDPARNLQLGTRYLSDLIDRFGGRVERALAAYNAGPSRVVRWTGGRRDMSAEEFIESIPFRETRQYVMNVLSHREHYRRLYSLPGPPARESSAPQAGP